MDTVTIRAATEEDQGQWLRLRRTLWPDCDDDMHRLEMSQTLSSDGIVFVAEQEGVGLVGFAEVSLRHDHVDGASITPVPYLEGWFVDSRFRRRGIGRSLVAAAERWAAERGCTEFASDAEIDNHTSIVVHKTLGFREGNRTVHFIKTIGPEQRT